MSKIRIGFDIDGVLRDFIKGSIKYYIKYGKYPYSIIWNPEEMDGFDIKYFLKPKYRTAKYIDDVLNILFRNEITSTDIFLNSKPYPDIILYWDKLYSIMSEFANVYMVTSQKYKHQKIATLHWLDKHNIQYDGIVFSENKEVACIDFMIDDRYKNLLDISTKNDNKCILFLMAQPWNKNKKSNSFPENAIHVLPNKIYSVNSVSEYVQSIQKILKIT